MKATVICNDINTRKYVQYVIESGIINIRKDFLDILGIDYKGNNGVLNVTYSISDNESILHCKDCHYWHPPTDGNLCGTCYECGGRPKKETGYCDAGIPRKSSLVDEDKSTIV